MVHACISYQRERNKADSVRMRQLLRHPCVADQSERLVQADVQHSEMRDNEDGDL
jgi:hypothetical protein